MARSRLPTAKAFTSGAALKNAKRYRNRRVPTGARPLGVPYPNMTAIEQRYWNEFAAGLPWLTSRHRVLLRTACCLSAWLESDEFGITAARTLSGILSKLGATPIDQARVGSLDEDEDPAETFFRRRG